MVCRGLRRDRDRFAHRVVLGTSDAELYTYRAWSDADLDAAEARLVARGLVADGTFTDAGRAARERVETTTDQLCRPIIEALGDQWAELVEILTGWSTSVQAAGGYPATGPHDLAGLAVGG